MITSSLRFLPLCLILLTACSQSSPADESAAPSAPGDATKPMTDKQLATFLEDRVLPYTKSTREQMEALPSNEQTVIDIAIQNLTKQISALIASSRKAAGMQPFDSPQQIRQHLLNQNDALIKIKQASYDSIFKGYIGLANKDVLPPKSLETWHDIQTVLNHKIGQNYNELIKLATEAPAGESAPSPSSKKE